MHIGSSSSMPTTCPDAPLAMSMSLNAQNAQGSLCDWVFSGTLERFPTIKIAYAESQVGWMPFLLERMDIVWHEGVGGVDLPDPPSDLRQGPGVRLHLRRPARPALPRRGRHRADPVRDRLPPSDGTFPDSRRRAWELSSQAGLNEDEVYKLLRGNAIKVYGLDRFGITE